MELPFSLREDGTCVRKPVPRLDASPLVFQDGVASKDVFIKHLAADPEHEAALWARIFLPQSPTSSIDLHNITSSPDPPKLPLILYFHGGGFVLCSGADSLFHPFLHRLAKTVQAIVIAPDYRLAPEHRLPAAYDDCLASLSWVQSQAEAQDADNAKDPWLHTYADFSRCYVVGDSAGGNIVHNVSLKLVDMKLDPLHIKGDILIHPFFGGVANTETEEAMVDDSVIPLKNTHLLWELALPKGVDRDHMWSNPMSIPASVYANACLPKTLVAIGHGDPMKERQLQYFKTLKEAGADVHVQLREGSHGSYLGEGSAEKSTCFIKEVIAPFLQAC